MCVVLVVSQDFRLNGLYFSGFDFIAHLYHDTDIIDEFCPNGFYCSARGGDKKSKGDAQEGS